MLNTITSVARRKVVRSCAARFLNDGTYHLHDDCLIRDRYGLVQIDQIVVSVYGIAIIDFNPMNGVIVVPPGGGDWTQQVGRQNHRFPDPVRRLSETGSRLAEHLGVDTSVIHPINAFVGRCRFQGKVPDGVAIGTRYIACVKSRFRPVFREDGVEMLLEQIEQSKTSLVDEFLSGFSEI